MKKIILKTLSGILISFSIFSIPATAFQTGWSSSNHGTYGTEWQYITNEGIPARGWQYINYNWYYLGLFDGIAVKGLQTINGQDYYFDLVNCDMKHDQYVKIGSGWHAAMAWACSDGHIDYNNTTFSDSSN